MRTLRVVCCLLAIVGCSGNKNENTSETPPATATAASATVIEVPEFTISTAAPDIARGLELFGEKGCTACHKVGGGKLVGPDLKGVTARREERWLKKMILRPDVMIKEDEMARKLFVEHLTPMPNQNVDPVKELPMLLAYLKSVE